MFMFMNKFTNYPLTFFVKDGKTLKQMYVDMKYILCLSTNNNLKMELCKNGSFCILIQITILGSL